MGPRRFSRGNGRSRRGRVGRAVWLQWGRGVSAAEIPGRNADFHRVRRASMGPRRFSRGNLRNFPFSASQICSFNGAAAFQPRKCRGRHYKIAGPCGLLQWGRGVSAAEIFTGLAISISEAELQWGRGVSAAEIDDDLLVDGPLVVLQWGRGVSAAEMAARWTLPVILPQASMGPRRFSRGNGTGGVPLHW